MLYGFKLNKVINQRSYEKALSNKIAPCSKYPPLFNIDIHIDDSQVVGIEGQRHKFKTIIVSETDATWVDTVLSKIEDYSKC